MDLLRCPPAVEKGKPHNNQIKLKNIPGFIRATLLHGGSRQPYNVLKLYFDTKAFRRTLTDVRQKCYATALCK